MDSFADAVFSFSRWFVDVMPYWQKITLMLVLGIGVGLLCSYFAIRRARRDRRSRHGVQDSAAQVTSSDG